MLQRIYGTCWPDEAAQGLSHHAGGGGKRDHRRLGRDGITTCDIAAGSIFWHPKGWTLYRTVQDYMRRNLEANGYVEVNTPSWSRALWEASGH